MENTENILDKSSLADEAQKSYLSDERLKTLRPSHRMLMICFLNGMRIGEAASFVGCSAGMASKKWNDPSFRSLFEDIDAKRRGIAIEKTTNVKKTFVDKSERAQEILLGMMEDETVGKHLRYSICKEVLYQSGHKPKEEIEITAPLNLRVTDLGYNPSVDDPYMQSVLRREGKEIQENALEEDHSWDVLDKLLEDQETSMGEDD
jgi:hypothetical protein